MVIFTYNIRHKFAESYLESPYFLDEKTDINNIISKWKERDNIVSVHFLFSEKLDAILRFPYFLADVVTQTFSKTTSALPLLRILRLGSE